MLKQAILGIRLVFQDTFSYKVAVIAGITLAYAYYWLFSQTTSFSHFYEYTLDGSFGQYSYLYAVLYWILTLASILAFGVSSAILVWLWRRSLFSKITTGSGTLGAIIGAFAAGCPICGAFLLSFLGVTGGLAVFPLQGLELKILSLGLILGSTIFAGSKVTEAIHCKDCADITHHTNEVSGKSASKKILIVPVAQILIFSLAGLFFANQYLITRTSIAAGLTTSQGVFNASIFGIKTASSKSIIAPKLNPDGKTTSLAEQPTITDVPANPNTGDALADAKVVMMAKGKPFYAPGDISFDDPINAQKKWGTFEASIKLPSNLEARYQKMISTMTCSYCCGSPTQVTLNKQCGCAHAKAVRGFYKYMLQNYSDKYTDEEMIGESQRWYALWYPKGMLEDYLLATGKSYALPHEKHGGAGSGGMHGLSNTAK